MLEHIHSFLGYFSKLFVTLDGIGLAPVFIALTANTKAKWRNIMMNKAIVIAFFILLFFAYTGSVVLDLLDISLTALKIAGGILLLIMAIDLVLGNPEPAMNNENKEERKAQNVPDADFAGTLELSAATACEEDGCREISDVVSLVRKRHDKPSWTPYHAPQRTDGE